MMASAPRVCALAMNFSLLPGTYSSERQTIGFSSFLSSMLILRPLLF